MCQARPRALPSLCRILSSLCRILPSNVDGNGLVKIYLSKVYSSRSTLYLTRELSINKIPKNYDRVSRPSLIYRRWQRLCLDWKHMRRKPPRDFSRSRGESQQNSKSSNISTENMGRIRDRCPLFKQWISGVFQSHSAIAVNNRDYYDHDQSSRKFRSQLIAINNRDYTHDQSSRRFSQLI